MYDLSFYRSEKERDAWIKVSIKIIIIIIIVKVAIMSIP